MNSVQKPIEVARRAIADVGVITTHHCMRYSLTWLDSPPSSTRPPPDDLGGGQAFQNRSMFCICSG
ncbi:hypothetical protein EYC08_20745 [Tabrizicola sp. WMC-M-20]|nr:hypothetical protein EYC08_20745 [Tabrizicola sp. WMC-M-20]